ncbi:MAG TPA: hypothetical protein VMA73_07630 [Streptosporangiaceae bacterium]|nr:hypothetical protein [Streptosporangiaceae bacterium]
MAGEHAARSGQLNRGAIGLREVMFQSITSMAPAGAVALSIYARKARGEFNWLLHAIIPVLGIVAFLPAWFTAMGIGGSVLKFVAPLSYPSSETGLAIGSWYLIGIAVLIYLYARHPSRLPEMKRVFADEPADASGQPVTTGEAA